MWVSTERSYRLIQTPFKSANNGNAQGFSRFPQTRLKFHELRSRKACVRRQTVVTLCDLGGGLDVVVRRVRRRRHQVGRRV